MYTQKDLDELVDELSMEGYPDVYGTMERNAWCLYIEAEDGYETEVIDDIEQALLEMGYSPVGDFDDIEVMREGTSSYEGFSMYKYELLF